MEKFLIIFISLLIITILFRKHYLIIKRDKVFNRILLGAKAKETEESLIEESKVTDEKTPIIDYTEVNRTFRKADLLLSRGKVREAERWFIKVLSIYGDHQEALNRLGVIYLQKRLFSKAELIYRKLIRLNQKEAVYYSNFGRCLYSIGKLEEAGQMYEHAVTLDPSRLNRFISLGQIFFELRHYERALQQFLKAYERDRRNLEYLWHLADLYEVMGKHEEAKEILEKILELDPYNETAKEKLKRLRDPRPIPLEPSAESASSETTQISEPPQHSDQ